jgi:putative addiction module component (TIGR02574 family)
LGRSQTGRTSQKAELLDAVWESLEADALSLTDAQYAELDRPIERHEQNLSDVIPWEQVRVSLLISAKERGAPTLSVTNDLSQSTVRGLQ